MSVKEYRPNDQTLLKVIKYIESLDLCVYGPMTDLETGEEMPSNRDFDAEDVIKYRKLVENNELWYEGDEG